MKLDWLTILAIIIMVIGGIMVYNTGKVCQDPMKVIIQKAVGEKDISDYHAELLIFGVNGSIEKSYKYNYETSFKQKEFKIDMNPIYNITVLR